MGPKGKTINDSTGLWAPQGWRMGSEAPQGLGMVRKEVGLVRDLTLILILLSYVKK